MATVWLTDYDSYLFHEGRSVRSYSKLGAHPTTEGGVPGVWFAVWAPHAAAVRIIGDFNDWDGNAHVM